MCRFALSFNQRSFRLTVSPADAFNVYTCQSVVAKMALLWTTVAGVLAVADTAIHQHRDEGCRQPGACRQSSAVGHWYDLL